MAVTAPSASVSQDKLNAILGDALPRQGSWTDDDYLWLTDRSRRMIELTEGYIEELPVPTTSHQAILACLYRLFYAWLQPLGGVVPVVEVVGPDHPERDFVEKQDDYAEAGIPEYWIVDPRTGTITVLSLRGDTYAEHGVHERGALAESTLLPGFSAPVSEVFDAAESIA